MNKLIIAFLSVTMLLFIVGCSTLLKDPVNGKTVLKLYKDKEGKVNITGQFKTEDLKNSKSFSEWYNKEYNSYEVDSVYMSRKKDIKKLFKQKNIEIFMGTWCDDAKREVPRFMKIIDYLGVSQEKIKLIGVNRDKYSFSGDEMGKRIKNLPTFIFYNHGISDKAPYEIGRIVESPVENLEKDMLKILLRDSYIPNNAD